MKKILLFISFFTLTLINSVSFCSEAGKNAPIGMPPISDEELADMVKMLEQMDDETLEALAKIGEDYINEMQSQGKDPWQELFGQSDDEPQQSIPAPVEIQQPETLQPIIPKTTNDSKKIEQLKEALEEIADHIASIRQKAETDRALADIIKPWRYHLDDILYMVHTLAQDKLIKYLTEKDFDSLYKAIQRLHEELSFYEPLFDVKEMDLDKKNPYSVLGVAPSSSWQDINQAYQKLAFDKEPMRVRAKLKKEGKNEEELEHAMSEAQIVFNQITEAYNQIAHKQQAHKVLDGVLDALSRAIYTNQFISESKRVLKEYEPEAFNIRREQEKKEERARKEQEELIKKRPPYTPPVFDPSVFDNGYGYTPDNEYASDPGYYPDFSGNGDTSSEESDKLGRGIDAKDGGLGKKTIGEKKDKNKADGKTKKDDKPKEKRKKVKNDAVEKKLSKVEDHFDRLKDLIKNGPELGGDSGKKLFNNINGWLTTAKIVSPYQENDVNITKAKAINMMLADMTKEINAAKRTLRDTKELKSSEKADLKKEATKMREKFEKSDEFKSIQPLFSIKVVTDQNQEKIQFKGTDLTPISKELKYALFGIDEFATINDNANQLIKSLNSTAINHFDSFSSAYVALKKELPSATTN